MHVGSFNGVEIVVATNFVGSSAAAMVFEELITCGAEKVFEVGLAGGLQSFLKPGDIVVATEAICDEGTTCQYLHDHKSLAPSHSLKRLLIEALNGKRIRHHAGSVLTTDGIYMETSALYAVAKHRNVEIASALVISDLLIESGWRPAFKDRRVLSSTKILMQLAVEAASKT
jgi:uridine phosphorylase